MCQNSLKRKLVILDCHIKKNLNENTGTMGYSCVIYTNIKLYKEELTKLTHVLEDDFKDVIFLGKEGKIFFMSSKKVREKQKTRLRQWTFKKVAKFNKNN